MRRLLSLDFWAHASCSAEKRQKGRVLKYASCVGRKPYVLRCKILVVTSTMRRKAGLGYLPIEDHGVIGNLCTAALVGTDGTIDWLCLPAFDSPSVFCSILDDEKGGHFALRPVGYTRSQQIYLPDTNVLLTRYFSQEGLVETLDFMPIVTGPGERHRLVRNVRVIRGSMDFRVECLPAFDYARRKHWVSVGGSGAVFSSDVGCLGLARDVRRAESVGGAAGARFALAAGERVAFGLARLEQGEG